MTSKITRDAEHLSAAQRAMRKVRTKTGARKWRRDHYETVIVFDPDEATAMLKAINERVA